MRWARRMPDRSGTATYVHLIRAKSDPERSPRGTHERDGLALWRRRLNTVRPEELSRAIFDHLADGLPRTFNRIGVEVMDKTADVLFGTTFDEALWLLVAEERLLYTLKAPVRFRRADVPRLR